MVSRSVWIGFLSLMFLPAAVISMQKSNFDLIAEIDSCTAKKKKLQTSIGRCDSKLVLTLKILNMGLTSNTTEYLKIDKAHDRRIGKFVRLYNTVVIQMKQEQVSLVYPFNKIALVNNKAYEVFLTKDNTDDYSGCDSQTLPGLCGYAVEDSTNTADVHVQKGFCCPCLKDAQAIKRYHLRGGQDCTNKTLGNSDKDTYHSSAHCLKFDPLWYSVNKLEAPYAKHKVHLHAYIAKTDTNHRVWLDINGGKEILLGPQSRNVSTANGMFSALYADFAIAAKDEDLDHKNKRLLIPRLNPVLMEDKPLQMKEGPSRYLLLDQDLIDASGKHCNKAGVSYEAFVNQVAKCTSPAQSCLNGQPMHYWLEDVQNHLAGRKGKYFLSDYAKLGRNPILSNVNTGSQNLVVMYTDPHRSVIYIEMNADGLLPLHEGVSGQISEMYAEPRADGLQQIFVNVFNRGFVPAMYRVRLVRCTNTKEVGNRVHDFKVIDAHRSYLYVLRTVKVENTTGPPSCFVEVLNVEEKVVAAREVSFQHGERCICEGHCQCDCMRDDLLCTPMSQEQYHIAGFRGLIPTFISQSPRTGWQIALALLLICLLLLILGLMKAVIGMFVPVVARLGLSLFVAGKRLEKYYEKELWAISVVYNDQKVPVHPVSGQPVRRMGLVSEFCLNTVFFFYFPFIWIHYLIVKKRSEPAKAVYQPKTFQTDISSVDDGSQEEEDKDNVFILNLMRAEKSQDEMKLSDLNTSQHSTNEEFSPDSDDERTSQASRKLRSGRNKSQAKRTGSTTSVRSKQSSQEKKSEDVDAYPGSARKFSIPYSQRNLRDSFPSKVPPIRGQKVSSSASEKTSRKSTTTPGRTSLRSSSSNSGTKLHATASEKGRAHDEVLKLARTGRRIYYNYNKTDDRLTGSGNTFSLCGCLKVAADAFEFVLDIHNVQVYENVNGERRELDEPRDLDDANFRRLMSAEEVLHVITLYPLHPCLNKVLLNTSDSGGSEHDNSTQSMFFSDH